jgi:hypothetical protein
VEDAADADEEAVLVRLGVLARPPSVEALFELHRAWVERVPYETTWIALGERDEWFGTLAEVFGLRFDDVEPARLDELWSIWSDKHARWITRQEEASDHANP